MTDQQRDHNRRITDDLDWAAILIGTLNPNTGRLEGGLVASVARLAEFVSWQRLIDAWILRVVAALVVLRFLGVDHIWDLAKMFHVGG